MRHVCPFFFLAIAQRERDRAVPWGWEGEPVGGSGLAQDFVTRLYILNLILRTSYEVCNRERFYCFSFSDRTSFLSLFQQYTGGAP